MYSNKSYSSSLSSGTEMLTSPDPWGMMFTAIFWVVLIIVWIAIIVAMISIVDHSERKLAGVSTGMMWVIGLFATPLTLGVVILAIQNKTAQKAILENAEKKILTQVFLRFKECSMVGY